jgi:uncharacterized DUF497 family protein
MLFYWDDRNTAHIAEHGVDPVEAREVVSAAKRPYPRGLGGEKRQVRGPIRAGRHLQVIYVWRPVETIDPDQVEPYDRLTLADVDSVLYVIHARELTVNERRTARKRRNAP